MLCQSPFARSHIRLSMLAARVHNFLVSHLLTEFLKNNIIKTTEIFGGF